MLFWEDPCSAVLQHMEILFAWSFYEISQTAKFPNDKEQLL